MTTSPLQRVTSIATLTAMVFVSLPASLLAFSDTSTSPYQEAINALEAKGILEGYTDGTFKPNASINRAEFLKIVIEAAFTDAEIDDLLSRVRLAQMPDVDSSAWYARYVMFAMAKGIVSGYPDGTFKPEQNVNFVEASKILSLAYNQDSEGSGEWYVPYVKALDGSKAIPTSIDALDAPLTRGEMAEMMWRISEGKTDQPSQGYLNVKYPEATLNFASDDVQRAETCADLSAMVQEVGSQQNTMYYARGVMVDDVAQGEAAPMAPSTEKSANTAGRDADYSDTNVQVQGVDESDIVKTDGKNLYVVRGQTVKIVQATPTTSMKELATIDFSRNNGSPTELYIDGTTLTVISTRWEQVNNPVPPGRPMPMMDMKIAPGYWYGSKNFTDITIYNVSNPAEPAVMRTVSFEGNSVSTRRIDEKLYVVLQQGTHWYYPLLRAEKDLLPTFSDSAKNLKDQPITTCNKVAILPHVDSPEFMTVAVISTDNVNTDVKREVILGNAQNVYMSLDNLYVATTQWNYVWDSANPESSEQTNVFRFELTDDGVSMEAKGSVPGHILNQFSMDESMRAFPNDDIERTFRIATTETQQWDGNSPMTNNLYVLNSKMETIGSIEDIAPGEQIYSVRFMGKRAYIVTFRTIDPLFVIDLADARNPKILGKLKIPGFSNYLHPYDATHIIGFGKDAAESKDGTFAWQQGMKVAMFDVSDVANPKQMHAITIGDRGTDSTLLYNHKALLFEKDRDLLAFPISVSKLTDAQKQSGDESAYGSPVFQGAQVYDINLKDGFTLRGDITHYDEDARIKAGDYYYAYGRDIERITRIGSSLYTLSQYGIGANDEQTVKAEGMMIYKD